MPVTKEDTQIVEYKLEEEIYCEETFKEYFNTKNQYLKLNSERRDNLSKLISGLSDVYNTINQFSNYYQTRLPHMIKH